MLVARALVVPRVGMHRNQVVVVDLADDLGYAVIFRSKAIPLFGLPTSTASPEKASAGPRSMPRPRFATRAGSRS